jgi:hypothetical protein
MMSGPRAGRWDGRRRAAYPLAAEDFASSVEPRRCRHDCLSVAGAAVAGTCDAFVRSFDHPAGAAMTRDLGWHPTFARQSCGLPATEALLPAAGPAHPPATGRGRIHRKTQGVASGDSTGVVSVLSLDDQLHGGFKAATIRYRETVNADNAKYPQFERGSKWHRDRLAT